jgi:peptide deformylase
MIAQTREIALLGEPVLRKTADFITPQMADLAEQTAKDLLVSLEGSNGVGLAAPQIFESLRMMVVASKPTKRYPTAPQMKPIIMINPNFTPLSNDMEKDWEGCLSIPGIRGKVPRYRSIGIDFTDLAGQRIEMELTGFVARIFQHEYDHLEGLVYLDRIENNQDIISEAVFLNL